MSARIAVVVQARMGSTRLPGKVMKPVAGAPILQRMLERVVAAERPTAFVVACTAAPEDQAIVAVAQTMSVPCIQGHPTDLIDRHLQAARAVDADVIVKVPSDCPLIDPDIIDEVIGAYAARGADVDFVSNLHPGSWPDGNDVEVMSRPVLEAAWREAKAPMQREHTTPFIWDQPERFRVHNVTWASGLDYSQSHRWTLDYEEDYQFIAAVYDALWRPGSRFSLADILNLLQQQPQLRGLNAKYLGASWMNNHKAELRTLQGRP